MAVLSPEEKERRIRTNKKIFIIFGLIFVCVLITGAFFSSKQSQAIQEQSQQTPALSPEPAAQAAVPTTEQVRDEVAALLAELDGFRNTPTFKQCVYGCGKENPAKEWDMRRKVLQAQMNPQLDVPILLKLAPGELWALGMAYSKGKTDEVKELRDGIEKALQQ